MSSYISAQIKKYQTQGNKTLLAFGILATILSIATYAIITQESSMRIPNPSKIMGLILVDLIVFLILGILLTNKLFAVTKKTSSIHNNNSKLQNRIIIAFSLTAAIPAIIISIFSAYFFNFGLQTWFNKQITNVLDQSINVAQSYIEEHKIRLRESATESADDLSEMYYDLIHNPDYFAKALNAEAEMRSLDEAIVFQKNTNTILAQTSLSFSLSFITIPAHLIEKADAGEVVEVASDPTKIRMLVKLNAYNDTYLLIGRLVDTKIIDHIDKTNGAAATYNKLKANVVDMQIKFSVIFIFVALLLLLAAISWGVVFAGQIVSPIHVLVNATEKIKDGNLDIQVPEENLHDDELKLLSFAFNRMIQQIRRQQKDLIIAQRSLAWSDVARKVAHEVKNPLTPIQLSAERLYKKFRNDVSDKESFDRYVQTIIKHTNDIKKLVSEFVNFARLPMPKFVQCELVSFIKDIVESKKSINDKITYKFTANRNDIDFVCDTTQIRQVMINLLKNAEEALEKVLINPTIEISVMKNVDIVSINVIDNGVGFISEILEKATEDYVTNRSTGSGLGLAIVKKITEDHFGLLEITNNKNCGASITLIFNIKELKSKLTIIT